MTKHAKTVDIDALVADLPRPEQVLVNRLRALIAECIPQATEKAYQGVAMPFYTRNRLICFIWPPSARWNRGGNPVQVKQEGVALGFNQGKLMSNSDGTLLSEGRKQVHVMYFKKLSDIDEQQVRALLFEAAMIDEGFAKKKRK